MAWHPKVGRHVQVLITGGSTIKIRPGVITAVTTPASETSTINVRIGRGGQTFTAIARRTDPDENQAATKYIAA